MNELIVLMGQTVMRQLLAEVDSCGAFALIADEATDISHNKQLCFAIHWVDSDYSIHETLRNEAALESFYGGVVVASKGLTDEPVLPVFPRAGCRVL